MIFHNEILVIVYLNDFYTLEYKFFYRDLFKIFFVARKCIFCNEDVEYNGEEHHAIPKFLQEFTELNLDDYRMIVCKKHHDILTKAWMDIWYKIKLKMCQPDNFGDFIITKILNGDESKLGYIHLLQTNHDLEHNEIECRICSQLETGGWITKTINEGVKEGDRHITRYKLAINLKKSQWNDESIRKKILEFNSHCNPPEDTNIVNYHIKDIFKGWKRGL